jgi:hypothetical protein
MTLLSNGYPLVFRNSPQLFSVIYPFHLLFLRHRRWDISFFHSQWNNILLKQGREANIIRIGLGTVSVPFVRGNNWRRVTPPGRGVASRRCYLFKQRCVYFPHCATDCPESYCTMRPSFAVLELHFFTVSEYSEDEWINRKQWTRVPKRLSSPMKEDSSVHKCFDLPDFLWSTEMSYLIFHRVNFFKRMELNFKFALRFYFMTN